MELSGNVQEDLVTLISLYNLYGLKILTQIRDVNNNIFKYFKVKDLVNFSMINSQTIKLFDQDFWALKFKNDDLPIIKDKLNFKNYELMFNSKVSAEHIMNINKIEMNRDKNNGLIRIIYNIDNVLLKSILSNIKNEAIHNILNKVTDSEKRLNIGILPLEKDKYETCFFYDMNDRVHIIRLGTLHCTYKMILCILTLMQYHTTQYDINITDNNGLKFIIDDNYLQWLKNRLPARYKQHKSLLIKRMGIIDSLKYNNV